MKNVEKTNIVNNIDYSHKYKKMAEQIKERLEKNRKRHN